MTAAARASISLQYATTAYLYEYYYDRLMDDQRGLTDLGYLPKHHPDTVVGPDGCA